MKKPKSRGPLRADEADHAKRKAIPEAVFTVFNDLIRKSLSGGKASVDQDDAVAQVAKRLKITREIVFANGWMDVEDAYREVGWDVEYDKPGFNESYKAFFTFSRRSKRR